MPSSRSSFARSQDRVQHDNKLAPFQAAIVNSLTPIPAGRTEEWPYDFGDDPSFIQGQSSSSALREGSRGDSRDRYERRHRKGFREGALI